VLCVAVFGIYRTADRLHTDSKPPEIRFSGETPEMSILDAEQRLLEGVSALDDTDGDVTGSVLVESVRLLGPDGKVNVRYAAFDDAGNVAKAERQAVYTDYESPKYSLLEPLIFEQNREVDLLDYIRAEDLLDGDISHRVRAAALTDSISEEVGCYDIQCRVTNSLGDMVELLLPVEIVSPGKYNAELKLSEYLIYLPVDGQFRAESFLEAFSYNAESIRLNGSLPGNFSLKVTGEVDTRTPGIYDVTYLAIYTRGNQTYTGYSRMVVVVEG